MARFVKLTGAVDNEAMHFNFDLVEAMFEARADLKSTYPDANAVIIYGGGNALVKESPDDILAKLASH